MTPFVIEEPGPLPYEREPAYLSPSALHKFEEDPVGYYFRYLGPEKYKPARKQDYAAAVGEAFDASVKALAECKPAPDFSGVTTEDRPNEAKGFGLGMCQAYVACGAFADLRYGQGLISVKADLHGVVPGTDVPIYGKLDAARWSGRKGAKPFPHEFKTTGANRVKAVRVQRIRWAGKKGARELRANVNGETRVVGRLSGAVWGVPHLPGAWLAANGLGDTPEEAEVEALAWVAPFVSCNPSPPAGYAKHYGVAPLEAHERSSEPFERLHPYWADQLATYGWLLGRGLWNVPASLDLVIPQDGGGIRVAAYRTVISRAHQIELAERYARCWHAVKTKTVVPADQAALGLKGLLGLPKKKTRYA